MPTCSACGSFEQDTAFCTQCGTALGAARRGGRRKALIGIGVAAVLVLGAGLAFAIPALIKGRSGSLPQTGAGVDGLQVSNAPDLSKGGGSFLSGYQETWRFTESSAAVDHSYGIVSDAGDSVVLNDYPDDHSGRYGGESPSRLISVSKASGQKLWEGPSTMDSDVSCAAKPLGRWLVCTIGSSLPTGSLMTIDVATGKQGPVIETGIDGLQPDYDGWAVLGDALYLQGRAPDSADLITAKYTSPETVAWKVTNRIPRNNDSYLVLCNQEAEGNLVVLCGGESGPLAFDAGTGALVTAGNGLGKMQLLPGPTLLRANAEAFAIERKTLADGSSYCAVDAPWIPWFATNARAPIAADGAEGIVGFDPKDCRKVWTSTLPFSPIRTAWDGQGLAVVSSDSGEIVGVNVADGTVTWQSTVPNHVAPEPGGDLPHDDVEAEAILDDGTVIVSHIEPGDTDRRTSATVALDAATGALLWQAPFGLAGVNEAVTILDPAAQAGALFALDGDALVRLDPADEWSLDAHTADLPKGVPSCPKGMSPLTFSRYSDGAILVCGSKEGTFSVVAQDGDGTSLKATKLTFAGRSCEVGLEGGPTIRLSLGGAWVQSVSGSKTTHYAATEAWDYREGVSTVAAASAAEKGARCPGGSWPISLSTWGGGWLLVCGTSADAPTLLAYSDAQAGHGETTKVSVDQGGYCGQADAGQACAYAAPATVRLPGADGIQRSATASSFDKQGVGAQEGQAGAYGVTAPKDTAEDQVRYLVDILNSSAQTRANLRPVLDRVNHKNVTSAEIAALTTVSDSRRDLRAAVLAAPVDKVPDGQALVTALAHALQVSEDCDRLYVEWATIVRAGGDDAAIVSQWRPKAEESDSAKEAFLARWNSAIVPRFGVQSFTVDQI